ncbi:MAG: FHA domain-containing protein [Kiloniellales bacterium]|nr:FHA domain-containing protein [Kiloniellales bacterium]
MRSYVIGRSPYADIVLADGSVAGRHAEVVVTDDNRFYVTDCGSKGGTWQRRAATGDDEAEQWDDLRQAFVGPDALLRFGNHRCTLRGLLGQMSLAGGNGEPGRWRPDTPRESGAEKPRGRVERDPVTGEVVPKRL